MKVFTKIITSFETLPTSGSINFHFLVGELSKQSVNHFFMEAYEAKGLDLTGFAFLQAAVWSGGSTSGAKIFASCWRGTWKLAKSVRRTSLSLCSKGAWLSAFESPL